MDKSGRTEKGETHKFPLKKKAKRIRLHCKKEWLHIITDVKHD